MGHTSARKNSRSSQLTIQQRFVRWCFRPQRLLFAGALAVGILSWPQVKQSLSDVESLPEYQVGIEQISVTQPPHWVPEDLVAEVLHRVNLDHVMSLQDPTLSERIAAAFVTHPWIKQVHHVTKSFPAHIHVEVTFRKPVAIVYEVGGYYPIDASGCILPGNDFSHSDIDRYPIITNVSSVPVAGQGQSWGDPAVEGAARLAAFLIEPNESGRSLWEIWNLTAIKAPSTTGLPGEELDMEYQMETTGGSTIIWGRSPDTQHPGELSVAQKLQRLRDYHEDFQDDGGFDNSPVACVFDVRGWRGITRKIARGDAVSQSESARSVRQSE